VSRCYRCAGPVMLVGKLGAHELWRCQICRSRWPITHS
jgi:hypothetical protein